MGTTPTTNNQDAQTAGAAVSAGFKAVISLVDALVIADIPWLGWPGVKQLWEGVLNWIGRYFSRAAQLGVTFAIVDSQIESEQAAVSKELAALIAAEQSGDPVKIQTAIQAYANANSSIDHDDGSAPPR